MKVRNSERIALENEKEKKRGKQSLFVREPFFPLQTNERTNEQRICQN